MHFFLLQDEERESGIPESSLTFKECRCPQRVSERKAGERTRHLRIPLVVSSTLAAIKLVLGVRKARDSRGKRIIRDNPVTMEKKACPSPHPLQ